MKSVAHSLYLILMAFLSIIDPSTAGCYDELEKERWVMFKNESLSLVMAGDLMDSMNCTMKYYQNYTTWPEHLENNTNWKGLMNALKTCEINDTIKCQGRPKEEVPVFNFMCFLAKAVDLDLQGCGDYENLRSIYSRMPLQNSKPSLSRTPSPSVAPSPSTKPQLSRTPSPSVAPSRSTKPPLSTTPSPSTAPSLSTEPSPSTAPALSITPSPSTGPLPSVTPSLSVAFQPKPTGTATASTSADHTGYNDPKNAGRNCQDDPFNPEKRATDQNDKRVIVLKTLVVIFGISTIFGPVLVWLYMRQKVKMYTEQEVQDDNLL
ncbi:synaptojanin-1 isoform X5 [Oryzias latipes]|uniref:synaptojanin-1 isoform X5 n=1 Tax=Oryzias latipes TaxID=8090 RepID=UPI000CE1FE74|nr:synaptojanin-1 isoform X5 [Oryzias latipes]